MGTEPPVDDGGGNGGDPVSYAADVQSIWNANCIGCHGVVSNAGLDLRAPNSRTNLVGVAANGGSGVRVVADQPDQSVLYLKLTGAPGVGNRMPLGGILGAADIETVRLWIAAGAQDN